MATLIVRDGSAAGQRIEVGDETILGRTATDFLKQDSEVSRRHAAVRSTPDGATIEDLGSANGTFVNDRRIEGSTTLANGDVIRVGQTSLEVEIEGGAAGTVVRRAPATRVAPTPTPEPTPAPQPATPPPAAAPSPAAAAPSAPPSFGAPAPGYGAPPAGYGAPPPGYGPPPSQGVKPWVWLTIGGAVLLVVVAVVLVFVLGGGVEGQYRCSTPDSGSTGTLTLDGGVATFVDNQGDSITGPYTVDGNTLTIRVPGAEPDILTINGDEIRGPGFTCDKL